MQTAMDIAQMYAPDMWQDLERAILRHMEYHVAATVKVERERCAKLADDYSDWTYWGQHSNAAAAQLASREIAAAIRKGSALTTDEIAAIK